MIQGIKTRHYSHLSIFITKISSISHSLKNGLPSNICSSRRTHSNHSQISSHLTVASSTRNHKHTFILSLCSTTIRIMDSCINNHHLIVPMHRMPDSLKTSLPETVLSFITPRVQVRPIRITPSKAVPPPEFLLPPTSYLKPLPPPTHGPSNSPSNFLRKTSHSRMSIVYKVGLLLLYLTIKKLIAALMTHILFFVVT